jgi:hypothetical protein
MRLVSLRAVLVSMANKNIKPTQRTIPSLLSEYDPHIGCSEVFVTPDPQTQSLGVQLGQNPVNLFW